MRRYHYRAMEELARELHAGTKGTLISRIDTAEELIGWVQPTQSYSLDRVTAQLAGSRPAARGTILSGSALRSDLQALILDLCDSFDYQASGVSEKVYTPEALAESFSVSTKTIQRWRRQGLVARRMVLTDRKRRTVYLQRTVDAFEAKRTEQVERSRRFSQMTPAQQADIIRRARRMARRCDCSLHEITRRIARKTHRAVETVRYTIRRHDETHPDQAILPPAKSSSSNAKASAAKRRRRRNGPRRPHAVLTASIDYVHNEHFEHPDADEQILVAMPQATGSSRLPRAPKDLPAYLASLYEVPLLEPPQERHLFRKFNYLKYKAYAVRRLIDTERPNSGQLTQVERLLREAAKVKNQIVRANLRLVVSIARRYLPRAQQSLFELISDGNLTLMHAAERFDYARGYKFSTYASWSIIRNLSRTVRRENRYRGRFQTGPKEWLDAGAKPKTTPPRAVTLYEVRDSLRDALAQISPRERTVVLGHFGLEPGGRRTTLGQLGRRLGLSKERVRQIETQAMAKLRERLTPDIEMLLA